MKTRNKKKFLKTRQVGVSLNENSYADLSARAEALSVTPSTLLRMIYEQHKDCMGLAPIR